jgi:chorismate-pyruvate lyase
VSKARTAHAGRSANATDALQWSLRYTLAPSAEPEWPDCVDLTERSFLTSVTLVTGMLEHHTGEPIRTERVIDPLASLAPLSWWRGMARDFAIDDEGPMLNRVVVLRGARSRIAYVLAESRLATRRLPPDLIAGLLRPGSSIGRLVAARFGTVDRAICEIGVRPVTRAVPLLGLKRGTPVAWRSYAIFVSGAAAILVRDTLPLGRLHAAARPPAVSSAPSQPLATRL